MDIEKIVNNPDHYTKGNIEVIDFIEDQNFNFNLGNVVKYVSRAGTKKYAGLTEEASAVADLKKAKWYLEREIGRLYENIPRGADKSI